MPDEPLRDFLTHSVTEAYDEPLEAAPALVPEAYRPELARLSRARHGIQVNGHLSWRISSRNFGSQPAHFRRVLTLPLALLARTRPRAKRLTTAMFLAPWPVR